MIQFPAGAVTFAYVLAGVYFLRFWRKTADRLFLSFALAFGLMALNQIALSLPGPDDERVGYAYILRVLGYAVILLAIVDKNFFSIGKQE